MNMAAAEASRKLGISETTPAIRVGNVYLVGSSQAHGSNRQDYYYYEY
jgi:hypothetical protein